MWGGVSEAHQLFGLLYWGGHVHEDSAFRQGEPYLCFIYVTDKARKTTLLLSE